MTAKKKHQAPSTKLQRSSKLQTPRRRSGIGARPLGCRAAAWYGCAIIIPGIAVFGRFCSLKAALRRCCCGLFGASLELGAWSLVLLLLTGCTPAGPRALLEGQRLVEQGKYPQAVKKLRTATALLGTNAQAWN